MDYLAIAIQYKDKILNRLSDTEQITVHYCDYSFPRYSVQQKEEQNTFKLKDSIENKGSDGRIFLNEDEQNLKKELVSFESLIAPTSLYIQKLEKNDITIYRGNGDSKISYCTFDDIYKLINLFGDQLKSIHFPGGYRIPIRYIDAYISSLEKEFPTQNIYDKINGVWRAPTIYSSIDWDFDFLDKIKDKIDWDYVIRYSNLKWTEEYIQKYINHMPYVIRDYSIFGHLSNEFIEENWEFFDLCCFLSTGIFTWNSIELRNYTIAIESLGPLKARECNSYYMNESVIRLLFTNKNFKWNSELLKTAIELNPEIALEKCVQNDDLQILLNQISNYHSFVDSIIESEIDKLQNKISEIDKNGRWTSYEIKGIKEKINYYKKYWLIYSNRGEIPDDAYFEFFTIKNILRYSKLWENILEEIWNSMTDRETDSDYDNYICINKWDRFANNKMIKLNYTLCKFLNSISIKLGGYYKDYGNDCIIDYRLLNHNALEAFADHGFTNQSEMIKIIDDEDLFHTIMGSEERDNVFIIDYLIEKLLEKHSLVSYLEIVNNINEKRYRRSHS